MKPLPPDSRADALRLIAAELRHIRIHLCESRPESGLLTTAQFNQGIQPIMSAISDFSAKLTAHQTRVDNAVAGITSDIDSLKAKIEELQTSPGAITPEDQALLDTIEAKTGAVADKLDALDGLTPPPTPA